MKKNLSGIWHVVSIAGLQNLVWQANEWFEIYD